MLTDFDYPLPITPVSVFRASRLFRNSLPREHGRADSRLRQTFGRSCGSDRPGNGRRAIDVDLPLIDRLIVADELG